MNIKRKNLRIIPLFLLGLLYSCSPTVRVTTDYDRDTNFGEYKTFAVYDLKAQEGQISQLNVDRVTKAIRSEMLSKGFTETTASPDLKINAISILKNKTEVTANTDFYGYGGMYRPYGYWGRGAMMGGANTIVNTYDYVDGSLIIDIVSTKTKKLIWQGIGNAKIDSQPNNPEEFIASSVKKILAGFPPGLAKK